MPTSANTAGPARGADSCRGILLRCSREGRGDQRHSRQLQGKRFAPERLDRLRLARAADAVVGLLLINRPLDRRRVSQAVFRAVELDLEIPLIIGKVVGAPKRR